VFLYGALQNLRVMTWPVMQLTLGSGGMIWVVTWPTTILLGSGGMEFLYGVPQTSRVVTWPVMRLTSGGHGIHWAL